MRVTRHGEDRVRQRLGLPKRIVDKYVASALESGRSQADFKGAFRKHLDRLGIENHTRPIVHNGFIWIFGADNVLITVYVVPVKFRKYLKW